jgi:hypothetical protein
MGLVEHLRADREVVRGWVRQTASRVLFASLLVYHAGLLGTHVLDGRLLHPATSMRWFAGAFLLTGFLALRRLGVPLVWGRKAVVLWLLVVFLHGHAALSPPATGEEWAATQAPLGVLTTEVIGILVVVFGVGLVAALRRTRAGSTRAVGWMRVAALSWQATDSGFFLVCSARPPPSS